MKEKNAINELNLLLQYKKELLVLCRELDYTDNNRIAELRKFIDSLNDDTKIEVKNTNEPPF